MMKIQPVGACEQSEGMEYPPERKRGITMIKKKNRWGAFLLCGIMAISIGAAQLIPTIAKPECSCKVEIHGSNCRFQNALAVRMNTQRTALCMEQQKN